MESAYCVFSGASKMSRRKDMVGLRFGKLLVLNESHHHPKTGRIMWNCVCDCGKAKIADGVYLRSGHVKSCGCLVKEILTKRSRKVDSGFNLLLRQYKSSAKNRGYNFNLSEEHFKKLTTSNCFYCGDPPSKISVKCSDYGAYIFNGIDRLKNEIGYTEANCVACCEPCNFLKRNLNDDIFIEMVRKISKNLKLVDTIQEGL